MATPFLFALRRGFPESRITLLSRAYAAEVFRRNPVIDSLVVCSARLRSRLAAARGARPGNGFDACFVLPPSFSAALLSALSKASRRIGYGGHGREVFLTDVLPNRLYRAGHLSRSYLRLLEKFTGREEPTLDLPSVIPSDSWQETAASVAGGRAYFILAPGATYGFSKVWPHERYVALAKRISANTGLVAAIVGREEEREAAAAMIRSIGTEGKNLAGALSLVDSIAALRGARLVIGNDSGPVHISAALQVPTVAIFGPTSVDWTAPRGVSVRIVHEAMECAPCFKRRCPHGAAECLSRITVDAVYESVMSLIGEDSREQAQRGI
jgi:heptosyltransferase-2